MSWGETIRGGNGLGEKLPGFMDATLAWHQALLFTKNIQHTQILAKNVFSFYTLTLGHNIQQSTFVMGHLG